LGELEEPINNRPRAPAALVPLNRALSKLGLLSRAQATEAIRAGRVRVEGRIVRDPLCLIVPERTRLVIDGVSQARPGWRTLLFHKPRGVVTTRIDPEGRPTIYEIIGDAARGLIAVGRLDFATSGLLLLTNDTQLANWITDPASGVPRLYAVTVRGRVTEEALGRVPYRVTLRKASTRESHLTVELCEGRNRQVRRLFGTIGHEVTRLKRVKLGGFELGRLAPGQWREVSAIEATRAFPGARRRRV
jgi:pseudouridine synthase